MTNLSPLPIYPRLRMLAVGLCIAYVALGSVSAVVDPVKKTTAELIEQSPFGNLWQPSPALRAVNTSALEQGAANFLRDGAYLEAITQLSEIAARYRKSETETSRQKIVLVTLALADSYAASDQLAEATNAYQFYVELEPDSRERASVLEQIIDLLRLQERHEETASAIAAYLHENLKLAPAKRFRLMCMRCDALIEAGSWGEALGAVRAILDVATDPSFVLQYRSLEIACLVNLGKLEDIQPIFAELITPGDTSINDLATVVNLASAGDQLLAKNKPLEALALFKLAVTTDDLAATLNEQIDALKTRRANLVKKRVPLRQILEFQLPLRDLEKKLVKVQANPLIGLEIKGRIANSFDVLKRPFERFAMLSEIAARYPDSPLAEPSLYTSVFIARGLGLVDDALELAEDYIDRYPSSKGTPDILITKIDLLLALQKNKLAAMFIETVLNDGQLENKSDRLLLMLGVAYFNANDLDSADRSFRRLIADQPTSELVPAAYYWLAMGQVFRNHYQAGFDAFTYFLNTYRDNNPYRQDAAFRAAVCLYAMERYPVAKTAFENWIETFTTGAKRAEVYTFLGDLAAQEGDGKLAKRYFERTIRTPDADMPAISYAYQRMAAVYETIDSDWRSIQRLYETYLAQYGTTGDYATAIYQIGLAHQNLDENEQMLTTYLGALKTYGNNPEAVQMDDVATLFFSESERLSKAFPWGDWQELFSYALDENLLTLQFRLILAAKLAMSPPPPDTTVPDLPKLETDNLIAAAPPSALLASATQFANDDPAYSRALYQQIIDDFDDTTFASAATFELGRIEFKNENYDLARHYLEAFRRDYLSDEKAPQAIKLTAESFVAQRDYDTAIEAYKQILENRDWRGELWAEALFETGNCLFAQEKFSEAHAFFQRVYVLYGGYPTWVARAYIRAAEASEKLGLFEQAEAALREMVSVRGLDQAPDYQKGVEMLQQLQ